MIRVIEDVPPGTTADEFTRFVEKVEPRLRRALAGAVGTDGAADAVAEALTYAWANWDRVSSMHNPGGYLYRVARSAVRVRNPRRVRWLIGADASIPEIEPALTDALRALPERQRSAVWLVHACGWPQHEVADALGISPSAVSTHVARGLASLRRTIGTLHD